MRRFVSIFKYILLLGACIYICFYQGSTTAFNIKGWLSSSHTTAPSVVNGTSGVPTTTVPKGTMDIYVLDIGQGDAILVKVGDSFTLIDSGDVEHRPEIVRLLRKYGVHSLKNVIITHPHADHLGGFLWVSKEFPVEHVYDNGYAIGSSTFTTYRKQIERKKIPHSILRAGDTIDLGNGAIFEVYAPWDTMMTDHSGKQHVNNNSIVGKLIFGTFSMMMTGDAEKEEEAKIVNNNRGKLDSTILKVGHHGSKTASSEVFLDTVHGKVALISCGLHNEYGHPSKQTIDRLEKRGYSWYATGTSGTLHVHSNGTDYTIGKER